MIVRYAILAALLLAGCQHRTAPEPVVRIVEVKVPVHAPCPEKVPDLPTGLGPAPADQAAALSAALGKLLEWRLYGEEADAKMRACSQP